MLLKMATATPAFTVADVQLRLAAHGIVASDDEVEEQLTRNGYDDLGNGNWRMSQTELQKRHEKLAGHCSKVESHLRGTLEALKKVCRIGSSVAQIPANPNPDLSDPTIAGTLAQENNAIRQALSQLPTHIDQVDGVEQILQSLQASPLRQRR